MPKTNFTGPKVTESRWSKWEKKKSNGEKECRREKEVGCNWQEEEGKGQQEDRWLRNGRVCRSAIAEVERREIAVRSWGSWNQNARKWLWGAYVWCWTKRQINHEFLLRAIWWRIWSFWERGAQRYVQECRRCSWACWRGHRPKNRRCRIEEVWTEKVGRSQEDQRSKRCSGCQRARGQKRIGGERKGRASWKRGGG